MKSSELCLLVISRFQRLAPTLCLQAAPLKALQSEILLMYERACTYREKPDQIDPLELHAARVEPEAHLSGRRCVSTLEMIPLKTILSALELYSRKIGCCRSGTSVRLMLVDVSRRR